MSYSDIINKAQQDAAEKKKAAEAAEAQRLSLVEIADAASLAFINGPVLAELEEARRCLEIAGVRADVGNGQTGGATRRSLTVITDKSRTLLFESTRGNTEAQMNYRGITTGGITLISEKTVKEMIHRFLTEALS